MSKQVSARLILIPVAAACAICWGMATADVVATRAGGTGSRPPAARQVAARAAAPLINGGLPVVSPDGRRIAFISNRGGADDLYVIAADGRGEAQLTHTAESET